MARNNSNNLDEQLNRYKESNRQLSNLIEEHKKLTESFLRETSKEMLDRLTIDTNGLEKELKSAIKKVKEKAEYEDISITASIKGYEDFVKKTEKLGKQLESLRLEQLKLEKTKREIEKKQSNGTATQDELQLLSETDSKLTEVTTKLEEKNEIYKKHQKLLREIDPETKKYYSSAIKLQKELNKRQLEGTTALDDFNEKWEQRSKALKKGIKEISVGAKGIFNAVKDTLRPWTNANDEAMKYARSMGMSQKTADKFLSKTVSWAADNDIGRLFNKNSKELIQMQGKYSEVLGRNVQLTGEQKKDMLAMETFLGEDGMMDIANNLENFGMGLTDSANFVKKTMDDATKSGVVASKLTKTIRENIKMAQNYTFKDGLKGLSSMAKKAIELKTDMSLVNEFINKVSTVEGAISTGAQLQVLGGNYAMGSDPLSMMYESLNDVEGIFDRAVGMAKDKVFYNNQTGNFEMGAMDRYMMKQAATVMGINPQDMINVAYRQASLDKIEGQIKSSGIAGDSEMVEMVKNLATWKNGRAVVNIDGEDVEVGNLNSKDHKDKLEAMQRTDSQNLQDIAIKLRSINDIMSGEGKEIENEQAKMTKSTGELINDTLRNNGELLEKIAKGGALLNIINGVGGVIGGIFGVVNGILRSMNGVGNLFDFERGGKGKGKIGNFFKKLGKKITSPRAGKVIQAKSGINWVSNGDGTFYNQANPNRHLSGRGAENLINGNRSKFGKAVGKIGKSIGKAGGKLVQGVSRMGSGALGALGGGVAGVAISLAGDIISGEFKKDKGGSIGKAAGVGIGAAIGGVFGPVGAMVGGWLGGVVTDGIQSAQKRSREKTRNEIADRLSKSAETAHLAGIFSGENALQGNYKNKRLNKLEDALKDGILSESDGLGKGFISQLKENGDLDRLREQGISVRLEYANGGLLTGNSHTNGGMPILGSNMVVEGGEYVVNKKATRENLPLLEKINKGEYKMIPKEPLGKQMKVNENGFNGLSVSSTSPKINIEPISINLSGTIKLDTGNKQFDISNEILNNPQLISKLTEMINKQMNILDYGSYNKEKFKQKFA